MKRLVLFAIARYRASGGGRRWFGVDCNFDPTCSAYAATAIERFGLLRGLRLTGSRLRRCRVRDSVCRCLEPVPENRSDAAATRS